MVSLNWYYTQVRSMEHFRDMRELSMQSYCLPEKKLDGSVVSL